MLADALQAKGWMAHTPQGPFTKGDWELDFDTSHWMIVSSRTNPRVFDVPVPDEYHTAWAVNLIEHLCQMEDERGRLREALAAIRDMPGARAEARSAATDALGRCYHRWLVNVEVAERHMGRVLCPICGRTAAEPEVEPGAAPDRRDM
jgi:hypothetical protein